jgi:hypothetical protein
MAPCDVFVSYSQSDHDAAHELVARVESTGIRCWIAPRDITPVADWAEEIVDAIAASRVMVLVFSASANNSPQVRREVERAVHRGVHSDVSRRRCLTLEKSRIFLEHAALAGCICPAA